MPRSTKFGLAPLVLALAGLTAACGDSLSPVPAHFTGTYALQTVNGAALPATVAEGGGQQYILMADTLRFAANGRVTRSMRYRHISEKWLPRDTVRTPTSTYDYRIDKRDLALGSFEPCDDTAMCLYGLEEGIITESVVTIVAKLHWPGDPILRYRRVAGR